MKWALDGIARVAGTGRIFIGPMLALLVLGGLCLPSHAADIQKGVPETPSGAAAVAGTYCCHDRNVYRVVLTLNSNGTYWATGSSCLENKGDASGVGTWKLTERKIVLTPSKEDGWMKQEPKLFDVLKLRGEWILVRADWPDYYNQHGVTDVSCFQKQAPEESYTFLSDEEFPLLPSFKAVVEQKQPCAAYLKTADGKRLCIGGPGATKDIAGFVAMLEEGRTYQFPKAFLEYRKRQAQKQ